MSNDSLGNTAVVRNNTAEIMTAYTVATENLKAATKAAAAADKAAIKAAAEVDKAKADSVKADKSGNKAAADKAADSVIVAKNAMAEAYDKAARLHTAREEAATKAEEAHSAVLAAKAAADKAKAEEAAAAADKAKAEEAAKVKAAEEAAAAPMVLSNQEAAALDILKADSDKFANLSEGAAQLDAESLVVLAKVKTEVQEAYQNYSKVKVWDVSAIAKVQSTFPYILVAQSAEDALERFATERLNRSRSWVASRIKIIGYPVLLAHVTGKTMGIANEFASRFIVVTESMWAMAVSSDNTVKIGTTKIASHTALWAEYCKAAKEHFDGLATIASASTSTAFRKPGLDAQAAKFAKWESGLLDGTYVVENGIVRSKADKAAEEAKAEEAKAAAAADKAAKVKAAKAIADKAAKVKAAEEAAKAEDAKAAALMMAAAAADKAAEDAAAKAAAAAAAADSDPESVAALDKAEEAAKAAEEAAAAAIKAAEEANAALDKAEEAAKAAEEAKAAAIPSVLISDLIADQPSIEDYQQARLAEYAEFDSEQLESAMITLFEQLSKADRLDVVAYTATAVYIADNRQ